MNIEVNGVELYYEKTGQGEPIILLHGNGEDYTIFDTLINQLTNNQTVYAIDSRDHGKSGKVQELSYHDMTEDVAAFIRELNIEKPVLYGFSDGGIVGILLTIKYPDLLSKLIVSGVNINPDGLTKWWHTLIKIGFFFTRSSKLRMVLTEPNINISELNEIKTPTLVLAGSKDMIYEKHTKMIAMNIPNSRLKILKGENHGSYVIHSEKLYGYIKPYLSEQEVNSGKLPSDKKERKDWNQ